MAGLTERGNDMNDRTLKQVFAVAALFAGTAGYADGTIGFSVTSDRADALYTCGGEAVFTVTATNGAGEAVKDGYIRAELDNYGGTCLKVEPKIEFAKTNPFVVKGTLAKPGFLRLKLAGKDPQGNWIGDQWSVGFDVEKIRPGSERPGDFDTFWDGAIAALDRDVPADVKMERDAKASDAKTDCYRVSVATVPAGRRIRGQLSVPKGKGPWPVRLNVPGAGSGSWGFGKNPAAVTFTVNVLSYPPPATPEETKAAYAEENRAWGSKSGKTWYFEGGITLSREEYFYYGAILGVNRAVRWLLKRPEVDLKEVTYSGGSQGGAFGLILAALNPEITRAQISEPALTDLLGYKADKRQSGWPTLPEKFQGAERERVYAIAPYFDCAHFAARVKCPVRFMAGFSDGLCPPAAVYAGYNSLPAGTDKKIYNAIGIGHGVPAKPFAAATRELEALWK